MTHIKPGQDTFRGLESSQLRGTLFGKTAGEVEVQRDLLSVQSPISGSTLTAPDLSKHTAVKDPISGATLQLSHSHAQVVAPVLKQQQVHSRNFYLKSDVDVTIATLRNITTVSRYTNEKIGTAGTSTGLAKELVTGGQLRCSEAKHSKQQGRQEQQEQPQRPMQQQQHNRIVEQEQKPEQELASEEGYE